ncbi:MarR family winged helix-turn-helix transcriptional regulator [Litorihabitans aurantiacus]|uniref:MarR family transcriptional regulator n=1 Tax=Litorihabitans aurantiacus TaxID=1930061 RepID=A0AA37XDP3_9MICO|nr:MarR family transcriptional regulator [Litorihabitans aurantiacus]GMA30407.1 MarR family transcriptional regulator [Litorihabitans aurantiacus]
MPTTTPDHLDEVASQLRRAVLMTSRRLRAERGGDVTLAQYSVLARLLEAGSATPSDLAALEHVAAPSMTRTVRCLEEAGFVTRASHPDDGRAVLVTLTEAGHEVIAETRRRRTAWLAQRLDDLTPDELATLAAAADVLRRISTQ